MSSNRNIDLLLSFQTCKPIFFDPDLMFLMLLSEDVVMLKFPFYLFIYLNFFIYGTKLCLAYWRPGISSIGLCQTVLEKLILWGLAYLLWTFMFCKDWWKQKFQLVKEVLNLSTRLKDSSLVTFVHSLILACFWMNFRRFLCNHKIAYGSWINHVLVALVGKRSGLVPLHWRYVLAFKCVFSTCHVSQV